MALAGLGALVTTTWSQLKKDFGPYCPSFLKINTTARGVLAGVFSTVITARVFHQWADNVEDRMKALAHTAIKNGYTGNQTLNGKTITVTDAIS